MPLLNTDHRAVDALRSGVEQYIAEVETDEPDIDESETAARNAAEKAEYLLSIREDVEL